MSAISMVKGSTNFLRALVAFENGQPVTGATVTASISKTHGDVLPGLNAITFQQIDGFVTYNYQATLTPDQMNLDEGLAYEVEVVALSNTWEIRQKVPLQISE